MPTIFALLVGIDDYRAPVPRLSGCVNDIEAVKELLRAISADAGFHLDLRMLRNSDATRAAIIEEFRDHLAKATRDDAALFYYSGHGSQETAPPEHWHLEPDRLNETLVCYDSRDEGGWDLADKELAVLIAEIAAREPHVLCVLDCCHSGSGTRAIIDNGIAVRRAPTDRRERPFETFLEGTFAARRIVHSRSSDSGWEVPPAGRHILLAACRSSETAKEVMENGTPSGAFSASLLAVLRQTRGSISYRDLLKRVEALVRLRVAEQVPQIEANDPRDLFQPFLGGPIQSTRAQFTLRYDRKLGWVIDAGALHGIANPIGKETTLLGIFDIQTVFLETPRADAMLAMAKVYDVSPAFSRVSLELTRGDLDPNSTFAAVVTSTPLPGLGVRLQGEAAAIERVRHALQTAGDGGGPSVLIRESTEENVDFGVQAANGAFRISRRSADRLLVDAIVGFGERDAEAVVRQLEHIARWEAVVRLENPWSKLANNAVEILVLHPCDTNTDDAWVEADPQHSIRLEYRQIAGEWEQPRIRIELRNQGAKDLYCALLWLGEDHSINSGLIPGTVCLPAGSSVAVNSGDPVWGLVPDGKWRAGRTEVRDILKLIICTEQFDATLFDQEVPDQYLVDRSARAAEKLPRNTLERLAARVHYRDLTTRPGTGEKIPDWAASELAITVVRPLEAVSVPLPDARQDIGVGVALLGHPALKAKVRLTSLVEAGRGLGNLNRPAVFRDETEVTQPFLFETPRGMDPGLAVLQLIDVENAEAVTADMPLRLQVATQLQADEHVLPFAWDGEFFLPLGAAQRTSAGMEIVLRQLPAPLQLPGDAERGVISSVRILFQKVLSSKLGWPFDYPHLAAVALGDSGTPTYEVSVEIVANKVAQAEKILLYVHGIFGDTLGMTTSSRAKITLPNTSTQAIGDLYDLVLAFDFENIKTDITETAKDLKNRLAAVGLGSAHGKTLHVVAHSLGGLVTRWFIEREGGKDVIQHLVMLGTPHAGSPWSTLEGWATAMLAIGLNGLAKAVWPAKFLGDLVRAVENVDVTLDQMAPDSPFLAELASSSDPSVAYTLLVGNTSIIPAAITNGAVHSLLARLSPQRILHASTGLAFLGLPNDIAVSVASAQAVPQRHTQSLALVEVACDHITFFSSDAGRRALLHALLPL